jgi:hypothetical protein
MKWQLETDWNVLVALEQLAKQDLEQAPHSPGHWISLLRVQKQMGKTGDVEDSLDKASAAFGHNVQGRKDFLAVLLKAAEFDRAVGEAEALAALAPDDAEVRRLLERAVIGSDRLGPAERRILAKTGLTPVDLSLNQAWNLAETDRDFRAIVARCRALLAENPIHTDARCFLAHALARIGESEEARLVMALDDLVRVEELSVANGDSSEEQFRAVLAAEIRGNPTLAPDPRNKATRNGLQTARLGLPGEQAIALLGDAIKTAVENYVDSLNGDADAFIAGAPKMVRFLQWAVIYHASGYQISHRHPSGWLSGVFYVAAPYSAAADLYGGSLLVGAPQIKVASPPWDIVKVEPVPGRIVLFPSFIPHATEPCGIGERICVAFDIMPVSLESV